MKHSFYPVKPYLLIFIILALSAYSLYGQVTSSFAKSLDITVERHERIIAGDSEFYNPWQYRILSPYIIEGILLAFESMSINNQYLPFLFFKFLQHVIIFTLALAYFKKLQIRNWLLSLLGLVILSYSFSVSTFQADLSFNTYTDIIFYLLACLLILNNKPLWLIPLTILACLNRETSGLIPFLTIAFSINYNNYQINNRKLFFSGLISLIFFIITFIILRWYYGIRNYESMGGIDTPFEHLIYNLTFPSFYFQLIGTLSIIPLIAIIFFKRLSYPLKIIILTIVPIWIIIHLFYSLSVETRLFLVPHVIAFLPAALLIIERSFSEKRILSG